MKNKKSGYLKKKFKELFLKQGYIFDNVFDWLMIPFSSLKHELFGNLESYLSD